MNRWQRYYRRNRDKYKAWRATPHHKAAQRKARAKWKRTDAGKLAAKQTRCKYHHGITLEERAAMYAKQNGLCGLCNKPLAYTESHLDHDHKTGRNRSLVHPRCNTFLGFVENNPELAPLALSYIRKHKES